jgi:hypothetical protein
MDASSSNLIGNNPASARAVLRRAVQKLCQSPAGSKPARGRCDSILAVFDSLLLIWPQPGREARKQALQLIRESQPELARLAACCWPRWQRAIALGRDREALQRGFSWLFHDPAFHAGSGKRVGVAS